jgi:DNA-binding response OmpR family regulator
MTTFKRLHDPSWPAKRTILVVDDESSILTVISRHVSALGHRPLTALSADQALKTLAAGESGLIDTVIVNIVMPGRDGVWLIDQLAAHYPRVRIVIATGLDELHPRISLGPNVVAYLVKPFSAAELRNVLDMPN